MTAWAIAGYELQRGSPLDRAQLVRFMQRTYSELYPDASQAHLAPMVEQYFRAETPVWWVYPLAPPDEIATGLLPSSARRSPVGCLWMGTAQHQGTGIQQGYIFLIYVQPEHRRQGIGTALMQQAEIWATTAGYQQIALQVFTRNRPAYELYERLGYQPNSVLMLKDVSP